jgi:hypothetical protein
LWGALMSSASPHSSDLPLASNVMRAQAQSTGFLLPRRCRMAKSLVGCRFERTLSTSHHLPSLLLFDHNKLHRLVFSTDSFSATMIQSCVCPKDIQRSSQSNCGRRLHGRHVAPAMAPGEQGKITPNYSSLLNSFCCHSVRWFACSWCWPQVPDS